jgi:saccharopine dehydrogenase (NAD+, L-lysine forming)
MLRIGLIREGKNPADNRVALTPAQCKWINKNVPELDVYVQSAPGRCYSDEEYRRAGIPVSDDITNCDILLGIKEVPPAQLIPGKTYLFFSHTIKKQAHNQALLAAALEKKITLVDYECLRHEDGQRILGFGFFAGIVGAHNGMMCYGARTGAFQLPRVFQQKDFRTLIHSYFGLKLPPVKMAVTGSGRVAHGILEIMNLMGVLEVEPEDFLKRNYTYPVYTQLKGADLYQRKEKGGYNREEFHEHPQLYHCIFKPYAFESDILLNGVYWDADVPRLFEKEDTADPRFKIVTIADITDDTNGSVPINLGDQTIENPVYGVDRHTQQKTAPYLPGSIDVMAVGNLPNELPRDASRYFGEQLIKFVLEDLVKGGSAVIEGATIATGGVLTAPYAYLQDYADGN